MILKAAETALRAWLVAVLLLGPAAWSNRWSVAAEETPPEAQRTGATELKSAEDLYQKKDYATAADRLEAVIAADPYNAEALLFAGLAHLRLDDPASAGERWQKFTVVSKDPKLAQEIGRYDTIVLHEANARYAKEAVARERELAAQPTSPRTVAVAPFRNVGTGEYAPLGKALASMLIDNLTLLPGVRVLEREHVNALVEEAKLAGTGLVEQGAAVRAGKLLRAGRVTAGSHEDWTRSPTHLRLEALLVDVDAGRTIASARTEALATEFYKLVPGVAEQFAGALGQPIENLPPDVVQKIEQPHTKSIKAVLLFGEALDALDRKDVDAARKACKALEKEDADFPLAKRKCAYIPLEWLALTSVVSTVEPMALAMAAATGAAGAGAASTTVSEEVSKQATEPSSYRKYALLGALALLIGGGAGGGYALSQGGGSSGGPPPNPPPVPPPGGNKPPTLQGVSNRSVQAGDTAEIDMQCFDSDSTSTSIQNTSAGPNSSFDQTSGNPASGRYRQATNPSQAGETFNVAFVCTDNGTPPASDTKTARITVTGPSTVVTTPTAAPTVVSCLPIPSACDSNPQCCSGSCGATNVSTSPVCCVPLQGACQSGGFGNECCRPSGATIGCPNGRCCLGPGSPCPVVGPDVNCCNGSCGPFGCDTQVAPTPTRFPTRAPTPSPTRTPTATPTPAVPCVPIGSDCVIPSDCCSGCCAGGVCCTGG